jgi:hypothetical protein
MTPQSFDIDTAKEIVGDTRMRVIEAKARQDADSGIMDKPAKAHVAFAHAVEAKLKEKNT